MVGFHIAQAEDIHHDLGIDLHVFREQDAFPGQVGLMNDPVRGKSPLDRLFELVKHAGGEQRLCNETVHTCPNGLFEDVIPLVCREDDYR